MISLSKEKKCIKNIQQVNIHKTAILLQFNYTDDILQALIIRKQIIYEKFLQEILKIR